MRQWFSVTVRAGQFERYSEYESREWGKIDLRENQNMQLIALEKASKNNVDIKLFTETLEKSLGKSIRSIMATD